MIYKSFIKILSVLLIIGLNWAGLSAVIETMAYLNDTEDSNVNSYQAGILDFSLTSSDWAPSGKSNNLNPGDTIVKNVTVVDNETLGFQYRIRYEFASGSQGFCDSLQLEANLNGSGVEYNDLLKDFIYNTEFSSPQDWVFKITFPVSASNLAGSGCDFKFVFEGWQENILNFGDGGFTDTHKDSNGLMSSGVKINKVYYDVDDEHGGSENEWKYEWIELYNSTAQNINLKNWEICDNVVCEIINQNVSIPALGYALLAHDNSVWVHYWEVPDSVTTINLGGSPTHFALNNDADMLILKNNDSAIVDQMNWGIPSESWDNYNSGVWNPGINDVDEGHMLGRIPNGFDTDQPSDWQDLEAPFVQVTYPNGAETWWIGRTYTLTWLATNQNGPDTDLSIDIYYSADSGATWGNIVSSISDSGVYNWTVPLFIGPIGSGYYVPSPHARIKVVAHAPENFMTTSWDMSDSDFCPPIDYSLITPEELDYLKSIGLYSAEDTMEFGTEIVEETMEELITEEPILEAEEIASETITIEELIIEESASESEEPIIEEEITTESEETIEEGIIEEIDEIIDGIVEEIVEEITSVEPADEEMPIEEVPVIEETAVIEEAPTAEEPVIEEVPAIEEQPVIAPDTNTDEQTPPADNSGDGGDGGSGDTALSE